MTNSNATLIAETGTIDDRGFPWYAGDPDPTAEMIENIIHYFPHYAICGQGKLHSGTEDEKRHARTFQECCEYGGVIRIYFKDKARQIATKEARDIAEEALVLVDRFGGWFHPGGGVTEQDLKSYGNLCWSWRKAVRRFNMCMPSEGQQREQVKVRDTEQNREKSDTETKAKRKRSTKADIENRNNVVEVAVIKFKAEHERPPTVDEIMAKTKYSRQQVYWTDAYQEGKMAKSSAKATTEMIGGSIQRTEYYGDKSEEHGRAKKRSKSKQAELDALIDEHKKDDESDRV